MIKNKKQGLRSSSIKSVPIKLSSVRIFSSLPDLEDLDDNDDNDSDQQEVASLKAELDAMRHEQNTAATLIYDIMVHIKKFTDAAVPIVKELKGKSAEYDKHKKTVQEAKAGYRIFMNRYDALKKGTVFKKEK